MDLGWFYGAGGNDLYLAEAYHRMVKLFFMQLTYIENGQDVTIKPFPIEDISTVEEFKWCQTNFPLHFKQVEKWMNWVQGYMSKMDDIDYEGYKEIAREDWNDDTSLQRKYPNFDDYWEKYRSSQNFWDMVGDNQRRDWDEFHKESEQADAFEVMDREIDEYFDSHGGVFTSRMDRELDYAREEVQEKLNEIEKSGYDFEDWNEQKLYDWIMNVFDQNGRF